MKDLGDLILHFNPVVGSDNIGDEIISSNIKPYFDEIFSSFFIMEMPTQQYIVGLKALYMLHASKFCIVGGTNLLSSNMEIYNQWKINLLYALLLRKKAVLMGVGWWQYQRNPNLYTRFLLKQSLSHTFLHAVRDSYTQQKLKTIGFNNTLVTGCPTMWTLSPEYLKKMPVNQDQNAVICLTSYNKNPQFDKQLIELALHKYDKVYFWPQGLYDKAYMEYLGDNQIIYVDPNLQAFSQLLKKGNVDYIGTRLHAGIHALNHLCRSFIVAVDNRAMEMKKDFNLPVIQREIEEIRRCIEEPYEPDIRLPQENIRHWLQQFDNLK